MKNFINQFRIAKVDGHVLTYCPIWKMYLVVSTQQYADQSLIIIKQF